MKILIVDDEALQRDLLCGFLEKQGYDVLVAGNGEEALEVFAREPVGMVLLDHRMPGMTGDEVLSRMKELNPLVPAIMITAFGDVDVAVRVMKLGAADFLAKPLDLELLLEKIRKLEHQCEVESDAGSVEDTVEDEDLPVTVVARSTAMRNVLSLARRMAPSPWNILLRGETGTGKELIGRLIHLLGPRADGPFVEVNCAAIPENLFESELFGHEKGSFTGASAARRGRFELAHGGTLFLDEIGELPSALQPKLLRAIQEKRVSRVGSERQTEVDVRLIAATNRDLRAMVESGTFREDLYYRLNVLEIELPPLRQRRDDIPAFLDLFVERFSLRPVRLTPETIDILIKYPYPGNVRELEHVLQRTLTLCRGDVVRPTDLPPELRHHRAATTGTLEERLNAVEREMILGALDQHGWVQTRAADTLGISERVLRYKIGKHGIRKPSP